MHLLEGRIITKAKNTFLITAIDKYFCVVESEDHYVSNIPRSGDLLLEICNLIPTKYASGICTVWYLHFQETYLSQLPRVNKFSDLKKSL